VIAIAHALGARDKYTEGHARRVSVYSKRLARMMGLPVKEVEKTRIGACCMTSVKSDSATGFSAMKISVSERGCVRRSINILKSEWIFSKNSLFLALSSMTFIITTKALTGQAIPMA